MYRSTTHLLQTRCHTDIPHYRRMTLLLLAETLIEEYRYAGYNRNEILAVLAMRHGIKLSLRTLARILKRLGLVRQHRMVQVRDAIQYELSGSGSYLGCRSLVKRLLSKYNIRASRQLVLSIQRELDPEGVALRRSHCITRRTYRNPGPNYAVHIDGYDKLKPFGFPIHAGVDGYSRRVLWLKVGLTNNNPAVVASYFMEYLEEIQGVPVCIRTDAGTENIDIHDIQITLREEHDDAHSGERSVIVGSSHSNQRVERWWSSMRASGAGYWIDMFKDLVDQGIFSPAYTSHIECIRFCFSDLLQLELNQIQMDWNQHRVRQCRRSDFMGGKPDLLFFMPEIYGSQDRKLPVNLADIHAFKQLILHSIPGNPNADFHDRCRELLNIHGKSLPGNCEEAKSLFSWFKIQLRL